MIVCYITSFMFCMFSKILLCGLFLLPRDEPKQDT